LSNSKIIQEYLEHDDIKKSNQRICFFVLGNYVAVGTMESEIQIWDLDIVNTIEPAYTLAGQKKKKKKKKVGLCVCNCLLVE